MTEATIVDSGPLRAGASSTFRAWFRRLGDLLEYLLVLVALGYGLKHLLEPNTHPHFPGWLAFAACALVLGLLIGLVRDAVLGPRISLPGRLAVVGTALWLLADGLIGTSWPTDEMFLGIQILFAVAGGLVLARPFRGSDRFGPARGSEQGEAT